MPISYQNDIPLRLDSNIIYYMDSGDIYYELYDIFAVKGGPSIKLNVGKWNFGNGFILTKSMNRWERRNDLLGTTFINCFANNPPAAEFIKDKNGNIIGSKGYYQDRLFYITDKLNMTIETIEAKWGTRLLKNGSWTGNIGYLQRKEADVVSSGLGVNLQRSNFIDYPMQLSYGKFGLKAILPTKGSSPNMWVAITGLALSKYGGFLLSRQVLASMTGNNNKTFRQIGSPALYVKFDLIDLIS